MVAGAEGFTVSVKMRSNRDHFHYLTGDKDHEFELKDPVIVSLRVLVGATSLSSIPKTLSVFGRETVLQSDTKKWYSFHLNVQEVALSLRCEFVPLAVSSSLSSNTIIDSIECFACPRTRLQSWIPTALTSIVPSLDGDRRAHTTSNDKQSLSEHRRCLSLALEPFAVFCKLQDPGPVCSSEEQLLTDLLRSTMMETKTDPAFDSAVNSVVASLIADEESCEAFRDKALLVGCSNFLQKCSKALDYTETSIDALCGLLRPQILTCLEIASQIGKCRPLNYFQSVGEGAVTPGCCASKFVTEIVKSSSSNLELIAPFVELILIELGVGRRSGTKASDSQFGSFESLRSLLQCKNESVVSITCNTVSQFCQKYESPSEDIECDFFAAQKIVACYQCDW